MSFSGERSLTFYVPLCFLVPSFHCSLLLKNGDTLSPAAATTAEEAMSVSHDTRGSSREVRVLPGDLGASGGAAPLGGDMAAAGAEGGSEESARESEAWAAAVPPVRSFAIIMLDPLYGRGNIPHLSVHLCL